MITSVDADFEYTTALHPDSSAVAAAYYNEKDQELVVVLTNDGAWLYQKVSPDAWREFTESPSTGSYYNRVIKRYYGPGDYMGYRDDLYFEEVAVEKGTDRTRRLATEAVGTPKGLKYAENAIITNNADLTNASSVNTNTATDVTFDLSPKANFLYLGSEPEVFDLAAPEPKPMVGKVRHEVVFTVEDNDAEKTYTVEAESVGDAVRALQEVGFALGLVLNVKRVTVYFE